MTSNPTFEESVESQTIKQLYDKLSTGIKSGLSDVASVAFSKSLITPDVMSEVYEVTGHSQKEKTHRLLSAIHDKISNQPSAFEDFVKALESVTSLEYLAKEMRNKKKELKLTKMFKVKLSVYSDFSSDDCLL